MPVTEYELTHVRRHKLPRRDISAQLQIFYYTVSNKDVRTDSESMQQIYTGANSLSPDRIDPSFPTTYKCHNV